MDPPWGGRDYKKYKALRLSIGSMYIEDIVLSLLNNKCNGVELIVIKLPNNYDFVHMKSALSSTKLNIYSMTKMTLAIVHKF